MNDMRISIKASDKDYRNYITGLENDIRSIEVGYEKIWRENWEDLKSIGGH